MGSILFVNDATNNPIRATKVTLVTMQDSSCPHQLSATVSFPLQSSSACWAHFWKGNPASWPRPNS